MRQLIQIGYEVSDEGGTEQLLAVAYSVLGSISFNPLLHNSGREQETTLDWFNSSNRQKTKVMDRVCIQQRGKKQLPKVIQGITFKDGIEIIETQNKKTLPDKLRHQLLRLTRVS